VQLIFCKDNANERNESLLSNCRVQLILCKDKKIIWKTNEMRTKIIGTIGSCMDFDACESKNGTIFVHIFLF
jgi:hypothetical protein